MRDCFALFRHLAELPGSPAGTLPRTHFGRSAPQQQNHNTITSRNLTRVRRICGLALSARSRTPCFFSLDSMSTRGASALTLQRPWQMMGALEAVDGMLLFGVSTAYLFSVMQVYWSMLTAHGTPGNG